MKRSDLSPDHLQRGLWLKQSRKDIFDHCFMNLRIFWVLDVLLVVTVTTVKTYNYIEVFVSLFVFTFL